MKRFFLRIFLSVWVVVVLTLALSLFAATWLPATGIDRDARDATAATAAGVGERLAADPGAVLDASVLPRRTSEDGTLRIFVIGPAGEDALGRRLPLPVVRWLRRDNAVLMKDLDWAAQDPRLTVHDQPVGGYRIVAYRSGFRPIARVLDRPGGRLTVLGTALAASIAVSFVLARFIALPVRRLRRASRVAAEGDLGVRVAPTLGHRDDELSGLARDFDRMTERLADLVDARERLLRDVSHELRSPLARLQAEISVARQRTRGSVDRLDAMEREVGLLDGLVSEILSFAHLETRVEMRRAPADLTDLVRGIAADATAEGRAAGSDVRVDAPAQCPAEFDADLLGRAVENVVRNALRHAPADAPIELVVADSGPECIIEVADRGPGVPDESLGQLFEPFFRVADTPAAGGVGLAIARRAVQLHGGTITAANRDGGGLRVEIKLPKDADDAE